MNQWTFGANCKRTRVRMEFDEKLRTGSTVWFAARWFNPRAQTGPMAAPICANLPGFGPAAGNLAA
jgi:hypothetical protein